MNRLTGRCAAERLALAAGAAAAQEAGAAAPGPHDGIRRTLFVAHGLRRPDHVAVDAAASR